MGQSLDVTETIRNPLSIDGRVATARQRERYISIVHATIEHLRTNGIDDSKMQQISQSSGAPLATIYRYFKSRDALLYVATTSWLNTVLAGFRAHESARRLETDLIAAVRASAHELIGEPLLLKAWARSNLSADPEVARLVKAQARPEIAMPMFPLERFTDQTLLNDLMRVMEHVWFSGVIRWAHGQKEYDTVWQDVERSMLMVLNAHRSSPDLIGIPVRTAPRATPGD